MYRSKEQYMININEIMEMDAEDLNLYFSGAKSKFSVNCSIIAHRNNINFKEKWLSRYSEAKVFSFKSDGYSEDVQCFCRSFFYFEDTQMLYLILAQKHL